MDKCSSNTTKSKEGRERESVSTLKLTLTAEKMLQEREQVETSDRCLEIVTSDVQLDKIRSDSNRDCMGRENCRSK